MLDARRPASRPAIRARRALYGECPRNARKKHTKSQNWRGFQRCSAPHAPSLDFRSLCFALKISLATAGTKGVSAFQNIVRVSDVLFLPFISMREETTWQASKNWKSDSRPAFR